MPAPNTRSHKLFTSGLFHDFQRMMLPLEIDDAGKNKAELLMRICGRKNVDNLRTTADI